MARAKLVRYPMETLLSEHRFLKRIFIPPPQSFDRVLGPRGLLVLSRFHCVTFGKDYLLRYARNET